MIGRARELRGIAVAAALLLLSILFAGCQTPSNGTQPSASPSASATAVAPTNFSKKDLDKRTGYASLPALGETPIEVKAYWEPMTGAVLEPFLKAPGFGKALSTLTPAEPSKTYESRRFLPFLPAKAVQLGAPWPIPPDAVPVGEMWTLPKRAAATFLKQLHPSASAELEIDGAGAYALLRARSKERWEIDFRVHAQFELAEKVFMWPAQFDGRMVFNIPESKIEYIAISVPDESPTNVALQAIGNQDMTGVGYLPRMELIGGDPKALETKWEEELPLEEAQGRLAKRFFAFQAIEWSPLKVALTRAAVEQKPLFAVVIAGPLDDQSC